MKASRLLRARVNLSSATVGGRTRLRNLARRRCPKSTNSEMMWLQRETRDAGFTMKPSSPF